MTRPLQNALARAVAQSGAERALPRARAAVDELNSQLATGYRIQRPSDDPGGFAQAKVLGRLQDRLAQYGRGIDAAKLWVDRTQTEIDAVADLFSEARTIGIRAANGVLQGDEMADHIESIRTEVVSRLTARSNGEYLFAGNQTDTSPLDATGAVAAGDFTGQRRREVAPGLNLTINATDALLVDGVAATDRLQALADAIRAGDKVALTEALDGAQAGIDHYIRLGAQTGTTARTLQNARDTIEGQYLVTDEHRASIEEIDLTQVLGDLQRRQVGLEAALRATAGSVQMSLLDYLP